MAEVADELQRLRSHTAQFMAVACDSLNPPHGHDYEVTNSGVEETLFLQHFKGSGMGQFVCAVWTQSVSWCVSLELE